MKNSAFKMKGFPQHAGVSPMRDVKPNVPYTPEPKESETSNITAKDKDKEYEIIDDQIVYTSSNVDRNTGESLASTKKKESILNKEKGRQVVNDLVSGIGMDLAKAAATTAVGRMLSKKEKKEPARIIGKDWKIT